MLWKEEYAQLAFPHKSSELQIEKAQDLKFQNIPNALYRYRSFTKYNIENLKAGVEWQSYPSEFNDPYDSRLTISLETFKTAMFYKKFSEKMEDLKKVNIELNQSEIQEIKSSENPMITYTRLVLSRDPQLEGKQEALDQIATAIDNQMEIEYERMTDVCRNIFSNGYLIVCFSEKKDDILMWSHYAENHTGYCIEYDFKALGPSHPRVRMLHPVIYNDHFFDATEYYINAVSGNRDFNNLYGMYPTITKSNQWKYEEEWRMIFPWGPGIAKDDKEKRAIYMPVPKRILLGAKVSDRNKKAIIEISQVNKIPVHQMTLDKNSYNLREEIV